VPGGGVHSLLVRSAVPHPAYGTSIRVRDLEYFGSNCDNCGDPANGNIEYCPSNLKLILKEASFHWTTNLFLTKWHFRQAYSFSPGMFWRRLLSACTQQQFFKPKALLFTWKTCSWTVQNNAQNALKVAILRYKIKNFSGEGALSPPQTPRPVGRGTSPPHIPPPLAPQFSRSTLDLGASIASIFFRFLGPGLIPTTYELIHAADLML